MANSSGGCPICHSDKITYRLTIHYWRENPLPFFSCSQCEACFAHPMPTTQLISQGNNALVRWYQQGRTFEHEFRDARQAYLRGRMLASRLARWRKKGTLLDLGCYNGFLPLGVRDHSEWEVEGLEISDDLSNFIQEKLKITCHNGTLENLKLPARKYDYILCRDLIEHINEPGKFLQELMRILKPGGRIHLVTPNGKQDLAFAYRASQQGTPITMLLNHILLFSPKTLQTALESVGLRIKKMYCYDVRYTAKDMGWFGLGKPQSISPGPEMAEAMKLPLNSELFQWKPEDIQKLRTHKKVTAAYGFIKHTLPGFFSPKVPAHLALGHEIYALAEKPSE
jgi:2-polyprenyl-3-methyl-5-hydroxy-6-metoxy-1,4-benzoquinol methylase